MQTHTIMVSTLAVKTLLAPALIGLASWFGRRWGPRAGGWFAALPLTSGPVVLVLALERGTDFATSSCAGVLLALVSLSAFALAYAWAARRLGWVWSCLLGYTAYLAFTLILQRVDISLIASFVIACAALAITTFAMPRSTSIDRRVRTPSWDIPLRMVLAASMLWALSRGAELVGPRVSGLLTPFPIAATILAAFTHHFDGAAATGEFLRSLLKGLYSFAAFFLVVGTLLHRTSTLLAFGLACVVTLALHAAIWSLASRSQTPWQERTT
jgi:hypothetical protein